MTLKISLGPALLAASLALGMGAAHAQTAPTNPKTSNSGTATPDQTDLSKQQQNMAPRAAGPQTPGVKGATNTNSGTQRPDETDAMKMRGQASQPGQPTTTSGQGATNTNSGTMRQDETDSQAKRKPSDATPPAR